MSIPGPLVHQQLMDAYTRLHDELANNRTTVRKSGDQREELDQDRRDALVRLAEHYLPELTPEAIDHTWSEMRGSMTQILHHKEDQATQAKLRLDDLMTQRADNEQRLVDVNANLDKAVQEHQDVVNQIEKTLQQDPKFVELSDRAALAEAALERAEENLAEIDQDAARKLPAYENSALFRYLYKRNYGASQYKHRGLTRHADRWLARLVDYQHAKKGYEFLRRTPDHMRELIAQDRNAFETVMTELERRRDQIANSLGLTASNERCGKLDSEREQLLQKLDQLLVDTETIQQDWVTMDDPKGSFYREAIDRFREVLSEMSTGDLKRKAEKTREITDDQIVASLLGVESDIEQLDRQARRRRSTTQDDYRFLEDLGRLIQRFRAAEFDSARSQFVDSFKLDDELQIARDHLKTDRLWKRLRKAQRWASMVGGQLAGGPTHALSQVLTNAMALAAGGSLTEQARRAGNRRVSRENSAKQWSEEFGSRDDPSRGSDSDQTRRS